MYPKRGAIAAGLTAAGLALLFSFKTPDRISSVAQVNGTAGAANNGTSNGTSGRRTRTTDDDTDTTPASGPTATPAPSTSSGSGSTADGTITGPAVQTQFGPVQLAVTLSKGTITAIQALELPSSHMRSAQISNYAAPILRQEALQAQSAQIDLVSGATFTSLAYQRSLQAVLDQAGI